ncbi:peptidoglycan-binding protein [Micromonospora sp. NPDC092111]|uniref:peptidoglycan-binding protein n=1 Tax=Micromonospora sp. NPDC092111 TaxID=3364289 RepID=UPI0037FF3059
MDAPGGPPHVVCGPIVRRVDPGSVAVFVAVRSACTVTLTVFEVGPGPTYARGATVATGSRAAVRLGGNLYVATVQAVGGLQQGRLYGYDLAFPGSTGNWPSLLAAGAVAAGETAARSLLSYAGDPRATGGAPGYPSFVTPPSDPGKLRIFHGSCRKPHGEGHDALAVLDPIIAAAGGDPTVRPHQLVLGGDQIYADDVADVLLAMVHGHDAVPARDGLPAVPALPGIGATLGLPPELLPDGSTSPPADRLFTPGNRSVTLSRDAKFTSGEAASHLMSLREYACMYLLAWSDQLWPATYPRFEHVFPADTRILRDPQGGGPGDTVYDRLLVGRAYDASSQQQKIIQRFVRWQEQAIRLKNFQRGLVAVRRSLANVATYMIADDHEVTDDWNMTREFVTGAVIGSELGRRIVRNAMAAYAVFQAWGNTPDRFAEQGAAGEPGRELLAALSGWLAAPAAVDDLRLRERLGLPTAIGADGRPARPAGALSYHFTVTWPRYQLVALDTRTWREYPAGAGHPGGLLLADHPLDEMISGGGVLDDEAVTVLAQPVAVFGMPLLEQLAQPAMKAIAGRYEADAEDAWITSDAATHKFLGRLLSAAPPGPDGVRRRRIVMLGGDIHFGSAERIRYSATLPYASGPDPAHPFQGVNRTEGVIAGFVSSALRNEVSLTRLLHDVGYVPLLDSLGRIDLVGWANEDERQEGRRFQAGVQVSVAADAVSGWWVSGRPAVSDYDRLKLLSRPPEWSIQVQFAHHDEADPTVRRDGTPEAVLDPAGLPREQALAQYLAAARNLDGYLGTWGNGKEIVGHNNLGEITFDWPAGERKTATQRLWWHLPSETRAAALTSYTIDLSYGCSLLADPPYGYVLRFDDHDARSGGKAHYDGADRPANLVTDRWVTRLQADLATLGFAPARDPGEFDSTTYWAVREFQTYARADRVAHEPAEATATRYSDRLAAVDVPAAERYLGPVSGVADLATQLAIRHWLDKRWRCPVVVEAWQVAGGSPQQLAAGNVWYVDAGHPADQRLYSRVVTGRPAGAGPAPANHPELIPLGRWSSRAAAPQWAGPLVEPTLELLPEALIPPKDGEAGGPSLAALATAAGSGDPAVADPARRRLSTFKVLRAVAENTRPGSTGGWFDVLDGTDAAVLRIGPFGWPADGPRSAPVNLPPRPDWRTQPGQLWAWLAALRATDRDAYEAMGGLAGLSGTPGWGVDGGALLYPELRVSRARPALSDHTGGAGAPIEYVLELLDLRGWHWVHRFTTGLRTRPGVRHGIWRFARQGLHDLLSTPWDPPGAAPVTVPDVPGPDGKPRRVRIGDLFTSERAVALLGCWQAYRAHHLVALGAPVAGEPPEQRTVPRAGTELRTVLTVARTLGPDFTGPPTGWTDAHETALITAIGQVAGAPPDAELPAALAAVRAWPTWPGGTNYQLPVAVLPAADRTLSPQRGSLRLDTGDLSRVTG